MDVVKLLTRSTRPSKSAAGLGRIDRHVPSAGTNANPQLFKDDSAPRGTKRKRAARSADGESASHEESSSAKYDFFAPSVARGLVEAPKSGALKKDDERAPSPHVHRSEAECKSILHTHRLKVTLLPNGCDDNATRQTPKSSRKKAKKAKVTPKKKIVPLLSQPMVDFAELRQSYSISRTLSGNIAQQGYTIPTEVQMGSLPILLDAAQALFDSDVLSDKKRSGVDLLTVAPTGSGKTLAFLIPVINGALQRKHGDTPGKDHRLQSIIICPTKELLHQIANEGRKLCAGTGVRIVAMRKGMKLAGPTADQSDIDDESAESDIEGDSTAKAVDLKTSTKADILVTTPQSLLNAISTEDLRDLCTLVLDEADVLLDPMFRDQTLAIWKACTNPKLRVNLWSATMGSNIESLVAEIISKRAAELGLTTSSPLVRLVVGLKDSAVPNVSHRLTYAATEPGKLIALRQLLHPTTDSTGGIQALRPPFLVFTQTIPRAVALYSELLYDIPASAGGSSRLAVLHSDLPDAKRDTVMTRFRKGEIWVLITTDILARGVDFRGINGVVNYDVPSSGAAYIHRAGRTGRAGRDGGVAVTLYTKEDIPYIKSIANIIAASEKQAVTPWSDPGITEWLLNSLPKVGKADKKKIKKYGLEARRDGPAHGAKGSHAASKAQISTKSGYEKRLENNKRGAIQSSKARQVGKSPT